MPFMELTRVTMWQTLSRLNTLMITQPKETQRSLHFSCVTDLIVMCIYICPESVFLHRLVYRMCPAHHACLLCGFKELVCCVYMVSGVGSNDQQVGAIVSAYIILMGVHNRTRPQAFTQISM